MHDQTFGIKCCQTKIMTRLLELSVTRRIHNWTFGIKYCQMKSIIRLLELSMTGLLELSVARRKTFEIKTKSMIGLLELSIARQKTRPDFWN
ncbi:hypothetical protein RCL_jg16247.t1 [Rhizophagus clarus]|uniref:Uncharacterized protein n=1 Tax=Rhizophagus clarus TaxID=94130 RepID=A0A8H3M7K8_9GLOM|nr:hypothetical protein RCL_jg16247.t1 [Rhizophagus clarus]